MEKTTSGLDENLAGALTYTLGWLTGALFLAIEPSNRYVRFHAWQSIILFGALSLAWFVAIAVLPLLGVLIAWLIILPVSVVLWLWLIFKAYQGERYKIPYAGDMAEQRNH